MRRPFPRLRFAAARRLLPALVACVLAAALVFGELRSGARFFFCASMGSLAERPCCTGPGGGQDGAPLDDPQAALDGEDDCCERLDLARMPEGTTRIPEPIRSAPLLAVLTPTEPSAQTLAPERSPLAPRADAAATESPPPTAPERCALHGVFLI